MTVHLLDLVCQKLAEVYKSLPFWYEDTYMYAHANFKRNKLFRYIQKAVREAMDEYGLKDGIKRMWVSKVLQQAMVDILYYGASVKPYWRYRVDEILSIGKPGYGWGLEAWGEFAWGD